LGGRGKAEKESDVVCCVGLDFVEVCKTAGKVELIGRGLIGRRIKLPLSPSATELASDGRDQDVRECQSATLTIG